MGSRKSSSWSLAIRWKSHKYPWLFMMNLLHEGSYQLGVWEVVTFYFICWRPTDLFIVLCGRIVMDEGCNLGQYCKGILLLRLRKLEIVLLAVPEEIYQLLRAKTFVLFCFSSSVPFLQKDDFKQIIKVIWTMGIKLVGHK